MPKPSKVGAQGEAANASTSALSTTYGQRDPKQNAEYVFNTAGYAFEHRFKNREEYFRIRGLGYTDIGMSTITSKWAKISERKPSASCATLPPDRLATDTELRKDLKEGMDVLIIGLYPIKVDPADVKKIGKDKAKTDIGQMPPSRDKDISSKVDYDHCYRVALNCTDMTTANVGVLLEREPNGLCLSYQINSELIFWFHEFRTVGVRAEKKTAWMALAKAAAKPPGSNVNDASRLNRASHKLSATQTRLHSYTPIRCSRIINASNEIRILASGIKEGEPGKAALFAQKLLELLNTLDPKPKGFSESLERLADGESLTAEDTMKALEEGRTLWPEIVQYDVTLHEIELLSAGLSQDKTLTIDYRMCKGFILLGTKMIRGFVKKESREPTPDEIAVIVTDVIEMCGMVMSNAPEPSERLGKSKDMSRQFLQALVLKLKEVREAFVTIGSGTKTFTSNQSTDVALDEVIVPYAERLDVSSAILIFDQAILHAARGMGDKMDALVKIMDEIIEVIELYLE